MVSKIVATFAAVKQKHLKSRNMEKLSKEEMSQIFGGGYWVTLGNGTKIYIPDEDEGYDDNDMIFV